MYQGHLNDGSSIQKHSAGGVYPYIVFARQCGPNLRYAVMTPKGEEFDCGSYDSAVETAIGLKETDSYIRNLAH